MYITKNWSCAKNSTSRCRLSMLPICSALQRVLQAKSCAGRWALRKRFCVGNHGSRLRKNPPVPIENSARDLRFSL